MCHQNTKWSDAGGFDMMFNTENENIKMWQWKHPSGFL